MVILALRFSALWDYSGLMVKTSFQLTGFGPVVQLGLKQAMIAFVEKYGWNVYTKKIFLLLLFILELFIVKQR